MWYVNLAKKLNIMEDDMRFILTMWYVNSLIANVNNIGDIKFYINYVVCKYINVGTKPS